MNVSRPGVLRTPGEFFAFSLDITRMMARRPFQWREFVEQAWFIASVTLLPAMLVSIPFGAVISLQIASLTQQLGAQSFTGATSVLAVVREAAPIASALLISGAAGSAICADLGSRKIREEIDAMEVLGVSPLHRLVVPRVYGAMFVAAMLNGLVIGAGLTGGYVFNIVMQNGTPGAYLASFTALASMPDLYVSEIKAVLFGWIAGLVGAYKGLRAAGGPKGVGQGVNEAVVITFLLLFAVNFLVTAIYFQLVPQQGV